MTDPDSPDAWAQIEANEVRLWISAGRTGLWCTECALPSGVEIAIQTDPAQEPTSWSWLCTEIGHQS